MSSPPSSPHITTDFSQIPDLCPIVDTQDVPRTSSQLPPVSGALNNIPAREPNRASVANAIRSSAISLTTHQQNEAVFKRNLELALKRLMVDMQMLGVFRVGILAPHLEVWDAIAEWPAEKSDLAGLDEIVGKANKEQAVFSVAIRASYDKLRENYKNEAIDDDLKRVCALATLNAQANIARLIDVASFVTSVRHEVLKLDLASASLFDGVGVPTENASLEQLDVYIKGIEKVAEQVRKKRQTLSETPQPLSGLYDSYGLIPGLNLMTTQRDVMRLREKLLQAVIGKGLDRYRVFSPKSGEPSETIFDEVERTLDHAIGYAEQSLMGAKDRVALADELIKHPKAKDSRSLFRRDRDLGKSRQTQATMSIVRARGMALLKTAVLIAPNHREHHPIIRYLSRRADDLTKDAFSCYASVDAPIRWVGRGNSGAIEVSYMEPISSDIRLQVMALIADALSDLIIDVERLDAQINASAPATDDKILKPVRDLRESLIRLENRLTDHIDDAVRTLPKEYRGKVYQRHLAMTLMRKARQYVAEHMASFTAQPYQAVWDEQDTAPARSSPAASDRAQALKEQQYAALVARQARDVADEFALISERVQRWESGGYDERYDAHGDYGGGVGRMEDTFEADCRHADAIVEKMQVELDTPSLTPMSASAIWQSVQQEAATFNESAERIAAAVNALDWDITYLRENGHVPASGDLEQRALTVQARMQSMIHSVRERAAALTSKAEEMKFIRQKTLFVQKPAWANYVVMRDNGCITDVFRWDRRSPIASRENDYIEKYVIHVAQAQRVVWLSKAGEPELVEENRVVVHVHYESERSTTPTACHFKIWDQRGDRDDDGGGTVHYDRIFNPETAKELIGELNRFAAQTRARQQARAGQRQ